MKRIQNIYVAIALLTMCFSGCLGNDGNSDCGYGAGDGWGNVTGGSHPIVWMPPWYAEDSTANIEDYHEAAIFIIIPSSNAQFGVRMPNDRQAAIIRSVADMSAEGPSVDPGVNFRKRFYNAFSGDFNGVSVFIKASCAQNPSSLLKV